MPTKQKIQVVIEVELTHNPEARTCYPLGSGPPKPEAELEQAYARELLAALRADPARYTEFVKTVVLEKIQMLEESRELVGLSGHRYPYSDSLATLDQLMPQLSHPAQEHFRRAQEEQWLSESVDLLFNAVRARPTKMVVHYLLDQAQAVLSS